MSTTHTYTEAELTATTDLEALQYRASQAGYTNPFAVPNGDDFDVTVDETAVPRPELLADINTNAPAALSLSLSSVTILGDGVASQVITVSDSRTTGASGKIVKVEFPENCVVRVDVDSLTLDTNGDATITFGPTPVAGMCSGPIVVRFYYEQGREARSAYLTLRFGT